MRGGIVKLRDMVEWQHHARETRTLGNASLTPLSQALVVRTPVGGLVWNRPVAILVERDGQEQRFPIVNVLLRARLAALGLGLTLAAIALISSIVRRK